MVLLHLCLVLIHMNFVGVQYFIELTHQLFVVVGFVVGGGFFVFVCLFVLRRGLAT